MKSFEPGFIESQPITQNLLRTVRLLGEYKGKEELFKQQIPQALETLRQAAIMQSTESSNRIEGVTAPLARIQALVSKKTTPRNRSEQEIAGYRDVLQTMHANHMVELERMCPHVTRDMIRVVLNRLKAEGEVVCEGAGRGAVWRKRGSKLP